jgi:HK97 family phage major capsid protein
MSGLQILDEKIGSLRREIASAVDAQSALYSDIDALQAKGEVTADEQKALDEKSAQARKATSEINKMNVKLQDLLADRETRAQHEAAKERLAAATPRQAPAATAGEQTRVEVKEATEEQIKHDVGQFFQAHYIAKVAQVPVQQVVRGEGQFANHRNDRLSAVMNQTNNAGILPAPYVPQLVKSLRSTAVVRGMEGIRRMPLLNGTLRLPTQTGQTTANYVGEMTNIPLTDVTTAPLNMTAKKLTVMSVQSGELMRRSDPESARLVYDDIVLAVAEKEDVTFIRATGSSTVPGGMKGYGDANGAAFRVDATAFASATVITVNRDLGKLQLKLSETNLPNRNRYWIFTPRIEQYLMDLLDSNGNARYPEMARGMLKGSPYKTTTQIPNNLTVLTRPNSTEIYYVEASELIIADAPTYELQVSTEAAYHDGSNVQAAFSQDAAVFRLIVEHDFIQRRAQASAYMQGVDWNV